jgi:hypothetical protein
MDMHPYRVFVSYTHRDRELIDRIVAILRGVGLQPLLDVAVGPGDDFSEAIKSLIAQAHVFMPVITPISQACAWVHQETGYALALRIPVLTLAIDGEVPTQMTAKMQAILTSSDLGDLASQLRRINFENIVTPTPTRTVAPVEVVDWPERRSEVIASHADWLWQFAEPCRIRHRGPLTSFSIPDAALDDDVWNQCGEGVRGSEFLRHLLRSERRSLERHAREAGCSLIINPAMMLDERYVGSRKLRLNILIDFLEQVPDEKAIVVIVNSSVDGSIILVGDRFSASSHAPRQGGYRQTVINWHAPTVLQELRLFDEQVANGLKFSGLEPERSRTHAIDHLKALVADLPA